MHRSKLQNAIAGWSRLTGLLNVIKYRRSNGVDIHLTYFLQSRQQMIQTCITTYHPRKTKLFRFMLCSIVLEQGKILHSKWVYMVWDLQMVWQISFIRTFSRNSKIIFLVACLDMTLTGTLMEPSHHPTASLSASWVTRYIQCKPVGFITHRTMFSGNQTRLILPAVLMSLLGLHHSTSSMVVIHMSRFGMLGSSESIMPRSSQNIHEFRMEHKFAAWTSFGYGGSGMNQTTVMGFVRAVYQR